MKSLQKVLWVATLLGALACTAAYGTETNGSTAGEYGKHFAPLGQLAVLVAEAMPAEKDTPNLPKPADKAGITRFLGDSFQYCSDVIGGLTEAQLSAVHNSPDGRLPGREVLLAMYIHVAHHRGQAEIYLRDNGIKPPGYRI